MKIKNTYKLHNYLGSKQHHAKPNNNNDEQFNNNNKIPPTNQKQCRDKGRNSVEDSRYEYVI